MPKRESAFFQALKEAQDNAEAPPKLTLPTKAPGEAEETVKRPDVQTVDNSDTQTPNMLDIQTAESSDVQTVRRSTAQKVRRSDVQAAKRSDVQMSNRSRVTRANSKGQEPQTIYLTPDLRRWLKSHAALEGRDISEIVEELLQHYRARQQRG